MTFEELCQKILNYYDDDASYVLGRTDGMPMHIVFIRSNRHNGELYTIIVPNFDIASVYETRSKQKSGHLHWKDKHEETLEESLGIIELLETILRENNPQFIGYGFERP